MHEMTVYLAVQSKNNFQAIHHLHTFSGCFHRLKISFLPHLFHTICKLCVHEWEAMEK